MENKRIAAAQERRVQNGTAAKPLDRLKGILSSEAVKRRLADTMQENAGMFSSSIIELFTSDGKIGQCDPALVIAEALKAASLKLPINRQLGFAYIVPYRDGKRGGELCVLAKREIFFRPTDIHNKITTGTEKYFKFRADIISLKFLCSVYGTENAAAFPAGQNPYIP